MEIRTSTSPPPHPACRRLLTLDCDLTHQPSDCARFVAHKSGDVVVGNRFRDKSALADWNAYRKLITNTGYAATQILLGIPYDATGALRRYKLDKIGVNWLSDVSSDGYAFFFESLMVLHRLGFSIEELPIQLPKRTYGSSKMNHLEVLKSCKMLLWLFARRLALGRK